MAGSSLRRAIGGFFFLIFAGSFPLKIASEGLHVGIDFGIVLGGVLEASWGRFWEVFWTPRRPQDGPKTAQMAPRRPRIAPKRPQDGPKVAPRCFSDGLRCISRILIFAWFFPPKLASENLPDDPKTPQDCPKTPQDGPQTAQDGAKTSPR